jgi:hypothetical protein
MEITMADFDKDKYRQVSSPSESDFLQGVTDSAKQKELEKLMPYIAVIVANRYKARRWK